MPEVRIIRNRRKSWWFWEMVVARRPWAFRVSIWLVRDVSN